jgi:hypothetical protein
VELFRKHTPPPSKKESTTTWDSPGRVKVTRVVLPRYGLDSDVVMTAVPATVNVSFVRGGRDETDEGSQVQVDPGSGFLIAGSACQM